jgi:putative membrane protein
MVMDWTGAAPIPIDTFVSFAGPLIAAALLGWLLVQALLRQGRYRVVESFVEEDVRAVRAALAQAEHETSGEILPVVVERSDPHPGAEWLAALCCVAVGSSLAATWLPWDHPPLLLLSQAAMGALGFALARILPDFKRRFVFEDRATAVAQEQALLEFHRNGLHRTEGATGVLLFVSLFERRAIVLADEGIDRMVDADFWAGIDDAILDGVRRGCLRDGLVAGIRVVGERLARHFPIGERDRDEIPDRVIVRRE